MPDTEAAARLLETAVQDRLFPAAVAEVGSRSAPLWRQAFGHLTFDPHAPPAAADTIFDLASLTKPLATTAIVLRHVAEGTLTLEDRVAGIVREWQGAGRERVTVRHLLEHASGLSARLLDQPPLEREAFVHEICAMPLEYPPGQRSIYSDLGFILLGWCAEARGRSLADQAHALIHALASSSGADADIRDLHVQVPPGARDRTAPTVPLPEDHRRGRRLIGEVHDNYAAALGGFAGHAGLFGTGPAVGTVARAMLRALAGDRTLPAPFTPALAAAAVTKSAVPGSSRALGWDTMLPTSSCGTKMSARAFGHVGFTGTSLWIDPGRDRYFVLLTNRACEGGTSDDMQRIRRAFHNALGSV